MNKNIKGEGSYAGRECNDLLAVKFARLESLARAFFESKFTNAQGLWRIQLDIVNFQIDLRSEIRKRQETIKNVKNSIACLVETKRGDWKSKVADLQKDIAKSEQFVESLKTVIGLAKQVADAFVWIFLKADNKVIKPLTMNKPNADIPDGKSLKGMLAIAEQLAQAGAGYPLIHDATNCLRVGDLTFCNILDPHDIPLTVEVKTRVLSVEDGIETLSVNVFTAGPRGKFTAAFDQINKTWITRTSKTSANALEPLKRSRKPSGNDRSKRQAKRMAQTFQLQSSCHLEILKEDVKTGLSSLSVTIKAGDQHHNWEIIRKLLVAAKESKGSASLKVDDAFLYSACYLSRSLHYCDDGVDTFNENILPQIVDGVSQKLIEDAPTCADSRLNRFTLMFSFEHFTGDVPPFVIPLLLYPLPLDLALDLLFGRSIINVAVNVGRLVEVLRETGFIVDFPEGSADSGKVFPLVRYRKSFEDGTVGELQLGNLNELFIQIGHEFMSISGFVDSVVQIRDSLLIAVDRTQESRNPNKNDSGKP